MSDLHVEVIGRGAPLVLLHGWAMHGGVFAPLIDRLSAQRTLHVVDLPGHGHSRDSAVPLTLIDAARAVRAVVPADAAWCGWSLGGLIALQAALDGAAMPALTMLCSTPRFVQGDDWPHGMAAQVFHDFAAGLRSDWQATLERFIALEAFGSDHRREELAMLQHAVFARGAPASHVLVEGLGVLETSDLRSALPTLAMPTLWLSGRRDRLVDPRAMAAAAAMTPKATHVTIAHAGHVPFLTHAQVVADALLPFLAQAGA